MSTTNKMTSESIGMAMKSLNDLCEFRQCEMALPAMEKMRDDLISLGWSMYFGDPLVWISPDGGIFRGPYKAWVIATGKMDL